MAKDNMPPNSNMQQLEAHEERIQKLEDDGSEVKSAIAVLTERIDTGFDTLGRNLDGFRSDLRNHASEDKVTATKVFQVANQIEALDKKQKARAELKSAIWKYVWAVILLVLGAGAKFLFDSLK